ncbi:MAG: hypothetical protein O2887_18805 [Bacteroidetes bacterium]|nr:hypothetical protein [Bacteroidota bacterium]MDA1122504.1 hypothetical protein [Bacteroidota bacterium]
MLKKVSRSILVFTFLFFLMVIPVMVFAQNSREIDQKRSIQVPQEGSKNTLSKRQIRKQKEKTYAAYFNKLVKEYEGRMEENAVKQQKLAKESMKPQYSDPSYFGHKKAPKKNKRGEKKVCKECGMLH